MVKPRNKPPTPPKQGVWTWFKYKRWISFTLFLLSWVIAVVPAAANQASSERIFDGVQVPSGEVILVPDFYEMKDLYIEFPFQIENRGYHQINHIQLTVKLKLNYTDKTTGNRSLETILVKSTEMGHAKVGQIYRDTFTADYKDFRINPINHYIFNRDLQKPERYLMDLQLSFTLQGIDQIWILMPNIVLFDSELDGILEEPDYFNARKRNEPEMIKAGISTNIISLIMTFMMLGLLIVTLRTQNAMEPSNEQESKNESTPNSKQDNQVLFSLCRISIFTLVYFLWDAFTLHEVSNTSIEGVNLGDYVQRYELATIYSMVLLFIISGVSVFEIIIDIKLRAKFTIKKDPSLFKSTLELAMAVLYLLSFYNWTFTAILSYEIIGFGTIIRDSSPSYASFLFLLWMYFALIVANLIITIYYKEEIDAKFDKHLIKNRIVKKGRDNLPVSKKLERLRERQRRQVYKKNNLRTCPHCHVTSVPIIQEMCPVCGKELRDY